MTRLDKSYGSCGKVRLEGWKLWLGQIIGMEAVSRTAKRGGNCG